MAEGYGPEAVEGAGAATLKATFEPNPGGAVFISYASQDASAAERIAGALRAAGIEVWFDQSELRGGDAWDQSIRKQIKTCTLFLPVISRSTHDRDEGYFRLEWKLAVDRCHRMAADKAFLLPVVIDDTRDDDERVPERFREVQWTRLPGGVTSAAFIERIKRLLSGDLAQEPTRTASEASRLTAAPTTRRRLLASWRSKVVLLATIAVGVVALGYLVTDRLDLSKKHVTEVGAAPGSAAQSTPAIAFNPPPHSIAVLAFVNMSGDPKQEYFSDGISDELLNSLSRLNELKVAARTSSFSFKGQNVDVSTIARKLNVGTILEGSVRRAGNTVRITVQLIDAVNGFHMWSQTYDRNLSDILKVQTDVATSVAQRLEVKLLGDEATRIELGGTKNAEAYDAYLRGIQLYYKPGTHDADYRAALTAFDQAISFDPNFAAAYARRSAALIKLSFSADLRGREDLHKQARAAAERAVVLAPEFGEAHLALAFALEIGALDFLAAAREFDLALKHSPGSAWVQGNFALFAATWGHYESALAAAHRAASLDPQHGWTHGVLSSVLELGRHYDEALQAAKDESVLDPSSTATVDLLRPMYALGKIELMRQTCESRLTPLEDDARHFCLAVVYHALGNLTEAKAEFDRLKAQDGESGAVSYATDLCTVAQSNSRFAMVGYSGAAARP